MVRQRTLSGHGIYCVVIVKILFYFIFTLWGFLLSMLVVVAVGTKQQPYLYVWGVFPGVVSLVEPWIAPLSE